MRHTLNPRPACFYLLRVPVFSKPQSTRFRHYSLEICRSPPALSVAASVSHNAPTPPLEMAQLPLRSEPIGFSRSWLLALSLPSCPWRRFRVEDGFCATLLAWPYDSN